MQNRVERDSVNEFPVPARSKVRTLAELMTGYGLILVVIWTPRPWQRYFYIAALLAILLATIFSFDGWRAMGFRITGFWRCAWVVAVALLIAAGAIALAISLQTLNAPRGVSGFIGSFAGYAIWSFFQQFLLQDFVLLRLMRLLPESFAGRTAAALTAAGLFALAHLPSPILTGATLVWGLAACFLFLRYRNLYPLAVAHAIFGITIAITIPRPVDHNMRVGLGYWRYHPPRPAHLNQSDHKTSTRVWVMAEAPIRRS